MNMAMNFVIFIILVILNSVTNSISNVSAAQVNKIFHGRYTRDVDNAQLIIPRHVYNDGKFKSFNLPNFYSRDKINKRRKRSPSLDSNEDKLHLILPFNDKDHHMELSPFYDFISPEMIIEIRGEGTGTNITKGLRFERATDEQCYYRGFIRGHRNSRAALSLCNGLAGYILTNDGRFFIEPLDDSSPGDQGQHVHIIYKRRVSHEGEELKGVCGTGDDWESAWTEQLANRERRLIENGNLDKLKRGDRKNSKSSTHSIHRYIEIALVADKKFLEFWHGEDIDKYLLTVMNMVADFYHDASVGNQIDVVVVRMIYLEAEKEESDLRISPNSEETLISFGKWAYRINPKDSTHPNHFDIAVLVTRHNMCSVKSGCALMGLANVAAACDPKKATALTEDSGLLLGIVLAHEVGHVMGSSHDQVEISGCPSQDHDKSYFIMSPAVYMYTLRWSTCSRRYISNLLNSGLGDCLMDNPKNPPGKFKYPNMLPGAMYDSDFQCSMQEPSASTCELGGYSNCRVLWCQKGRTCFSNNSPPAEGTKCGENKWCIRQQCVPMGERPNGVHGGWGEWSPDGQCSRTCGGGVKVSERECDNPKPSNGGRYCIGERRKISTCNTEQCDPSEPSYRAQQCTEKNSIQILSDGLHIWKPYLHNNIDECTLFCVDEKNTLVKMGLAKDATPCKGGTKNMCIAGMCRIVGCDWELDSSAIEDQCGICKGDGTQCNFIEGEFNATKSYGYVKIVTIPKQAKHIKITETQPSQNILAVKYEHDDKYCVNGNFKLNSVGEFNCAGSRLIYEQPQYRREEVQIKGPITDDIQIQLLFLHAKNPGINYIYSLPKSLSPSSSEYKPKYLWEFTQWSKCDVNCGGGTRISMPNCIEEKNGIVSDNFCNNLPRPPPETRICNEYPCPTKWRVSQWSKCSACKGHHGEKTRKVQCVKPAARLKGEDVEVDMENCKGSPPEQTMKCKGTRPCRRLCHPKLKTPTKRDDNSFAMEKFALENSDNIDSLINMGLTRYLEKAEDEDVNSEYNSGEGNENTEDELRKILHQWTLEHKEKRMCSACRKFVVEVETEVTEAVPDSVTGKVEFKSIINDAQTEVSTTESGLKMETADGDLATRSVTESREQESALTEGDTEIKSLSTLEPGTLIKDEYPPDNAVLLEAPVKDDSFKANLSDIAFQQVGDSAPIQIDTSHEKIYTGPEARERINELAYGNVTDITESPDSDITAEYPAE